MNGSFLVSISWFYQHKRCWKAVNQIILQFTTNNSKTSDHHINTIFSSRTIIIVIVIRILVLLFFLDFLSSSYYKTIKQWNVNVSTMYKVCVRILYQEYVYKSILFEMNKSLGQKAWPVARIQTENIQKDAPKYPDLFLCDIEPAC